MRSGLCRFLGLRAPTPGAEKAQSPGAAESVAPVSEDY